MRTQPFTLLVHRLVMPVYFLLHYYNSISVAMPFLLLNCFTLHCQLSLQRNLPMLVRELTGDGNTCSIRYVICCICAFFCYRMIHSSIVFIKQQN